MTEPEHSTQPGEAAFGLFKTGVEVAATVGVGAVAALVGLIGGGQQIARRLAGGTVDGTRAVAGGAFGRVEDLFELRMTRLLNAFHIPTRRDVAELTGRVEALTREVVRLEAQNKETQRNRPAPRRRKLSHGQ